MLKSYASDRPLVLLGAGGHARVLLALVRASGRALLGVCDPALQAQGRGDWEGVPVLGGDEALDRLGPARVDLALGVGQLARSGLRSRLYVAWSARGYAFPALVHPAAWVAPDVTLGDGVQIMAGAVVQPGSVLGTNVTVNTHASVDHDCRIGADVHIAPGAVLCGAVQVGDGAFIGAGAVLIQGLRVGAAAVVGAGVTLVRDLAPGALIVGPANRLLDTDPGLAGPMRETGPSQR
ncbi:acetyltransferase [Comamonas terrigena]|uniref:acetyltransferase n=1 Tax=Comamonas terrigena TaxID=32013 RepID=UPI00244B2A26|nr:acetyltransferase [Comamonas terrigena]MDH1500098.1 acetyltransferase [Comamonas terrigena]